MTMIKETVEIKLNEDFKEGVFILIENTINKVTSAHNAKLSDVEKKKIKNLTLDQINVNVSSKNNCKTIWVFSTEGSLPVIVERDSKIQKVGGLIKGKQFEGFYAMKPNLTWTLTMQETEGSVKKQEFEEKVLKMFLEDVETASFYGALSYVSGVNEY